MGTGISKGGGKGGGAKVAPAKPKGPAKQLNSAQEANGFFADQYETPLTSSEKAALKKYTGSSYWTINSELRNPPPGASVKKTSEEMDKGIAKAVLKEDIMVHRGSTADLLGLTKEQVSSVEAFKKSGMIGATVNDKGYLSTAAVGKGFGGQIMYEIRIPAGKGRGAYVAPISTYQSEKEFLCKRNGNYKITGAHMAKSGKLVVEMEMQP